MPSIIPGYEYDIFISYRQKDNKYDGWVTEFVSNLQKELDATFKESISIYFDENPYDGLRELHDVEDSLSTKLKCLIFIPVISQTYCDENSFAWRNEFLKFKRLASEDTFGLKVKLATGNVASRIIPVKIHQLDTPDKALLERELGEIRYIDFSFSSGGVNRPLRSKDDDLKEITHKVFYRDQINKVANAIKEIAGAMKGASSAAKSIVASHTPKSIRKTSKPVLYGSAVLLVMLLSYFFIRWYNPPEESSSEREKSIAILPFRNLSLEKENEYFTYGVMEAVQDHISRVKDLKVISSQTIEQYSGKGLSSADLATALSVSYLVNGSVQREKNNVRISIHLVDALNDNTIWSKQYDRELKDIFAIQSDIAQEIAKAMEVGLTYQVKEDIINIPTADLEAYDLYLKGLKEMQGYWEVYSIEKIERSMPYFLKAIELDPDFSLAYTGLGHCYWMMAHFSDHPMQTYWLESKRALRKAIELDPANGWAYAEYGVVQHNWEWDKPGAERSFRKALELMPGNYMVNIHAFWFYFKSGDCDNAQAVLSVIRKIVPNSSYRGLDLLTALCARDMRNIEAISRDTSNAGVWELISAYLVQKKYNDAITLSEHWLKKSKDRRMFIPLYAVSLAMAGRKDEARSWLDSLHHIAKAKHVYPSLFAQVYMALGDEKKAYSYLEKALAEKDWCIHTIAYSSPFYEMRNEKKFADVIERSWIPWAETQNIREASDQPDD